MAEQTRLCDNPHGHTDCSNVATDTRFVLATRQPSDDGTRIEETYRQVYVCDVHSDDGVAVPPGGRGVTVTRGSDVSVDDGPTTVCIWCMLPREECHCQSPAYEYMDECSDCGEYTELDHLHEGDDGCVCPDCDIAL